MRAFIFKNQHYRGKLMMKKSLLLFMAFTLFTSLVSCQTGQNPTNPDNTSVPILNVMTHDSFAISEPLVMQFEQENNVKVNFLLSGDTGAALNRAILTKNSPQADVFYGVDNTFLSRALSEGIFDAYSSPMLPELIQELRLDTSDHLLPVDYGDVCINYDKAYFAANNLAIPSSFADLADPAYQGLLVVENPATSSPGLAFLLATIAEYGTEGYSQYWQSLRENGVVVVNDWQTAYYTNFSASSGHGSQPMVVSYSTSPAAEVIFSETNLTDSPTASLTSKNMCFRQVEFIGILAGSQQEELSKKFVDFMLSVPVQEDIPLQMFVFPARMNIKIPPEFTEYVQMPDQPAAIDANLIAEQRDNWLENWTEVVLR